MRFVFPVIGAIACCAVAVPSSAQGNFGQIRGDGSPTVYVTTATGQEAKGRLITLSQSEITITTSAGPRTFTAEEVRLIEKKGDSLKNGALIGAAVGIFGSVVGSADMCSEDHSNGRSCAGSVIALSVIGTATYVAMGAGIDALIPGRTRIWPARPGKSAGLSLEFSPRDHRAFARWKLNYR